MVDPSGRTASENMLMILGGTGSTELRNQVMMANLLLCRSEVNHRGLQTCRRQFHRHRSQY